MRALRISRRLLGEWEPWLREKLAGHPEDVQARAYARALTIVHYSWMGSASKRNEMIKPVNYDLGLLDRGLRLLKDEHPESAWVANAEALHAAYSFKDRERTAEAIRRMNGRFDYRIWGRGTTFEMVNAWVTKKADEKK